MQIITRFVKNCNYSVKQWPTLAKYQKHPRQEVFGINLKQYEYEKNYHSIPLRFVESKNQLATRFSIINSWLIWLFHHNWGFFLFDKERGQEKVANSFRKRFWMDHKFEKANATILTFSAAFFERLFHNFD